jgi:pimeloyl-ACP methyl ester carboxylesterase
VRFGEGGAARRALASSGVRPAAPSRRLLRSRVTGFLLTAAGIAFAVTLALVLLLWWGQERVVFQPPGAPFPDAGGASRIDFVAEDGQPLYAYLVGDAAAAERRQGARLVLVFHGNADLAVWQLQWGRELARRTGVRVLLAEYRGYGGLAGTPTYAGSQRDARAAYAVARDTLGIAPREIAFFGHSLGSAIAAELAAELPAADAPHALVLQSPFTSAREMARAIVFRPALVAWSAIARVHWDTARRVRGLRAPAWVAHGSDDFVIPARMGRAVFEAAAVKGELLVVEGAGHNDVELVAGARYWDWLERALDGR